MSQKRKTITETELRERIAAGETHDEIAKSLGRPRNSIAIACSILGVSSDTRTGATRLRQRIALLEQQLAKATGSAS